MRSELRIGIVGAGQFTRARHLPGLLALPGVRVAAVCDLRRETAARVAREFDIPKVHGSWEDLVEDDTIHAVIIGAWPNLHCPVTLAALDAGKHVLTADRMAMNAREAQRMYDSAREHPKQTAMIVPSPYGLVGDPFMRSLIAHGFLGKLREVHVHGFSSGLADPKTPLSWRQVTKYVGFNMLSLGELYEVVLRWAPPASHVSAYARRLIPNRLDPESGQPTRVGSPDSVQVVTVQEDGSCGTYRISGVVWHNTGAGIALYGSEGTLSYDLTRDEIWGARRDESALRLMPIPGELRGGWQVEADFIAAIRGERPVTRTDFATGVRSMQFTEAVARSSRHQSLVTLPLSEFSNPSL